MNQEQGWNREKLAESWRNYQEGRWLNGDFILFLDSFIQSAISQAVEKERGRIGEWANQRINGHFSKSNDGLILYSDLLDFLTKGK